ncbi:uncharacterized protein LOC142341385 [Convolutriloba macropyga]|uniref:uncharacterized protein LOC142341385 n=1 Tax=Convolutriloba macropyga TaxID=536237 RepID=UPI003F522E50
MFRVMPGTKSSLACVVTVILTSITWKLVNSYATWDKYLRNKRGEHNYTLPITKDHRIICTGDIAKQEGRIWSPYYLYDNQVKTDDIQRLYGDEICKVDKSYCREPKDLEVLRSYDSFIDSGRRCQQLSSSGGSSLLKVK